MVEDTKNGSPAPFFAIVYGGDRLAPLRVLATPLLERHGLEVLVAASREEALSRAQDPSCVLLVDLSGEPALSEALKGRATPVLVAAKDPSRLVERLRPIVHHAKEAASALARMRS